MIHFFGALHNSSLENIQILYICFLKWPPQHINGNSNLVCFGMDTTTRIPKLFLTAQTANPPRFPWHVPNESIADKHPINIQIFCRKLHFRCQRTLCIIFRVQDHVRYSLMAALICLRSVETNLTPTCPSPKSFVCNLPDSGRHVTSVSQGLSLSLHGGG